MVFQRRVYRVIKIYVVAFFPPWIYTRTVHKNKQTLQTVGVIESGARTWANNYYTLIKYEMRKKANKRRMNPKQLKRYFFSSRNRMLKWKSQRDAKLQKHGRRLNERSVEFSFKLCGTLRVMIVGSVCFIFIRSLKWDLRPLIFIWKSFFFPF